MLQSSAPDAFCICCFVLRDDLRMSDLRKRKSKKRGAHEEGGWCSNHLSSSRCNDTHLPWPGLRLHLGSATDGATEPTAARAFGRGCRQVRWRILWLFTTSYGRTADSGLCCASQTIHRANGNQQRKKRAQENRYIKWLIKLCPARRFVRCIKLCT